MRTKGSPSTLVYAVKRGNVDVLKVLIEKGAIAEVPWSVLLNLEKRKWFNFTM